VTVWHDFHGEGPPVVLIHAGIADSRMWDPQLESFGRSHKVVRLDLPGFGRSPIESDVVSYRGAVAEALDAAEIERVALVGTSFGGRTALEFATEFPERVTALVLVGSGIDDHEWSEQVEASFEDEEIALERGDLDAAVRPNLELWLAGPRRKLDEIPVDIRELVAEMQLQAFRNTQGLDDLRADRLEPPASQRLDKIGVPTLVLTGDEDVADIHRIADRLAREIPGAERATIAGAAHLPNLERPDEFDRIVLGFLSQHGV
jgi:pimeloyl-ACP methyl ester carboxylesterase